MTEHGYNIYICMYHCMYRTIAQAGCDAIPLNQLTVTSVNDSAQYIQYRTLFTVGVTRH